MISLTADELSVPLSIPNSIRDIALRFCFECIRITIWQHKTLTQLHVLHVAFSVLHCFDVYEACVHNNAVIAPVCPFIFSHACSQGEKHFLCCIQINSTLVRRKPWVAPAKPQKKNDSQQPEKDQRRQRVKLRERRHQTLLRRLGSRDCRIQDGLIYKMITLNLPRSPKKLHSITLQRASH